ncbi:MAG: hypothetical protein AAFV80_23430, partial [Bacteroidota bacterium]
PNPITVSGIAFNTNNLSQLLLSNNTSGVQLGLSMLAETPVYVELMAKELLLLQILHKEEALREEAERLLQQSFSQEQLRKHAQPLQVFQIAHSNQYNPKVWQDNLTAYQTVMEDFDPLLQQQPVFIQHLVKLADRQLRTLDRLRPAIHDYQHPLFWYEKIVSLNEQSGKAHFKVANILQEKYFNRDQHLHRLSDAVAAYKKAIQLQYYPDLCHHLIGRLYEEHRNDWRNAKFAYEASLRINPNYTASLNRLSGIHLRKEKDYTHAWHLAEKSLQIRPKNALALVRKGEILIAKSGDFHGAKHLYHQALSMDQGNVHVLNAMGDLLYFHFKAPKEARQFFHATIKIAHHDAHAAKMIHTIDQDLEA